MSTSSLYVTSPTEKVTSNNFTTLYAKPVEVNVTGLYGNSNVEAFLYSGTDGANKVNGINDFGFLTVGGVSTLGPIGNVKITGGSTGYVLTTDGGGNLQFIDPAYYLGNSIPYIHFNVTSNGNNQQFTTGNIEFFSSNNFINLFKNGVNLEPTQYQKVGATTIQVNIPLQTGDTIDILSTTSGGGETHPGGYSTSIQYNNGLTFAGDNYFTYDPITHTVTSNNLVVVDTAVFSDVSNITITGGTSGQVLTTDGSGHLSWSSYSVTNANYANFAGTAFNVSGSNVTGIVGNATHSNISDLANNSVHSTISDYANGVAAANVSGIVGNATHSNISDVANSVSVANVVGLGNIATLNLDNDSNHVLYGNGVWANITTPAVANANYANFAGNAFSVNGINVVGQVSFAATANSVSVGNVVGIGNIATVNLNSSSSQVLYGNGVFAGIPASTNANYANYAGNAFSVTGSNVVGPVAYATVANSVSGSNVSGPVAFATTANSVAGANVSGQVGNALVAGTVYTGAQPNITSTGNLVSLTVTGMTSIAEAKEKYTANGTSASGTVYFDILTSAIILQTSNATANFTLNIRGNNTTTFNSISNVGDSISCTYVNKNGSTGFYANNFQIDGSNITPVWANGIVPFNGTVNGYDVYNFNILKTATSTYVVFGSTGGYL